MLAFISWHYPAPHVERPAYEQALGRFHRSLAHVRPSGLQSLSAAWIPRLPWERPDDPSAHEAYEDWYLLDGWSALGVLDEAAVAREHLAAHEAVASLAAFTTAGVYRLIEGAARLAGASSVWVTRPSSWKGHGAAAPVTLDALLGDGLEPLGDGLWRRSLGLGPAPEYCLQRALAGALPAGVGAGRLPGGWEAQALAREVLFDG